MKSLIEKKQHWEISCIKVHVSQQNYEGNVILSNPVIFLNLYNRKTKLEKNQFPSIFTELQFNFNCDIQLIFECLPYMAEQNDDVIV